MGLEAQSQCKQNASIALVISSVSGKLIATELLINSKLEIQADSYKYFVSLKRQKVEAFLAK